MRFSAILAAAIVATPVAAQEAERWADPPGLMTAYFSGDFTRAQALLEAELANCEASGPHRDECLDLLLALGNVALQAGDGTSALKHSSAAVDLAERFLPDDHPDLATGLNNFAASLEMQGLYADAERIYRTVLAGRERSLSTDDPAIAISYNNLATNLDTQGRSVEAEPLHRYALALRERVLPPSHPYIATSYNNLATNLDLQGRFGEAEPLYRKSLALRERYLPDGHPDIATGYNNLAANLDEQDRREEAEALYMRAIDLYEMAIPRGHPLLSMSYSNLGGNLKAQQRFDDAVLYYELALINFRNAFPENHPNVIQTAINLAYVYQAQGEYGAAESILREAGVVGKDLPARSALHRIRGSWALADNLRLQSKSPATSRSLYREAERGAQERVASYASFDRAAQEEIRKFSPIFTGQVQVAWRLAEEEAPAE